MNERQPYEQHLAEKLQQLPPPMEQDKAWEKMKALLEDELPRGNGSNGNGHWWIIGMIAGILLISTWMFVQNTGTSNTHAAKNMTAIENNQTADSESTTTHSPVKHPPGAGSAEGIPSGMPGRSKLNADAARTDKALTSAKQPNTGKHRSSGDPPKTDKDILINDPPVAGNPLTHHPENPKLSAYRSKSTQPDNKKEKEIERTNVAEQPNNEIQKPNNDARNKEPGVEGSYVSSGSKTPKKKNAVAGVYGSEDAMSSSMPAETALSFPGFNTSQLLPDQKIKAQYANDLLLVKPGDRISNAVLKKSKRRRDHPDRAFAVGLSLPLVFPISDQQALSYNWRGGANTVSDYIPSPHLQYHLNKKTFFQTEIQVISPQYIRPVLIYEQKSSLGSGAWQYNSVFARKLYYFNVPVSVYHSPLPNLFLGSGLQFSTLMSGIGMYENRTVNGNQEIINSQSFQRIGKDSLTNRMNSSELRLLLDVNYYWQRFTVGLRYNQALGNYLSFRLNDSPGYTYDKNKALFFYLRYNIWEDKKRKQPARQMLSLK